MKHDKLLTFLAGIGLAALLSCGAVGCLLTGFDLNVENRSLLWLVCAASSVFWGIALGWKWGGVSLLCLLSLLTGWLWHRGGLETQLLQLIHRISHMYDLAYGWGKLNLTGLPWNTGTAELPLMLLGCALSGVVCRTVCRGKHTWTAVIACLLPLISCLVVTNTVPGEAALFCLLLGLILLLMTGSVRRLDKHQAGRLLWLLLLPVAAVLALTFWLIPQDGYVNRSAEVRDRIIAWAEGLPEKAEDTAAQIGEAFRSDSEDTVNLKTLGRQSRQTYPVMDVTAQWSGAMYLREQDYDTYTGTGWTSTRHRSEEFSCPGVAAGAVEITTRRVREHRFLPYYPNAGQLLGGGTVYNPDREKTYQVERQVLPDNWRTLVQERAQGDWESEHVFATTLEITNRLDAGRYLALPEQTRLRAAELLEEILTDTSSATAAAGDIADYVRRSAVYDRDTGRMPADAGDFALWFLEESDTGYCVHFATAAVVLLRAAQVPARYVTGYLAHCTPGETVTVTAEAAHAWAEYYEPQLGCWIVLEATPAEGIPTQTLPGETESEAAAPSQSTQEPVPVTRPGNPDTTEAGPEPTAPTSPGEQTEEPTKGSALWLWLPVLMAAAVGQCPIRVRLRRRRYTGEPNRRALGHWQEILLLSRLRGEAAPGNLKELAQKAKYSQHTLTRTELAQMEEYIDDSVEKLKAQPWYRRLVYRLIFAAW